MWSREDFFLEDLSDYVPNNAVKMSSDPEVDQNPLHRKCQELIPPHTTVISKLDLNHRSALDTHSAFVCHLTGLSDLLKWALLHNRVQFVQMLLRNRYVNLHHFVRAPAHARPTGMDK